MKQILLALLLSLSVPTLALALAAAEQAVEKHKATQRQMKKRLEHPMKQGQVS
jgi:hypothetical protein